MGDHASRSAGWIGLAAGVAAGYRLAKVSDRLGSLAPNLEARGRLPSLGPMNLLGRPRPTGQIGQPVPRIPLLLDGKRSAPGKVREFDGQTLVFVIDDQSQAEGVVPVFTTEERAKDYGAEIIRRIQGPTQGQ
jgi:hypothetical protein